MINKNGKISKVALRKDRLQKLKKHIRSRVIRRMEALECLSFELALAQELNEITNLHEVAILDSKIYNQIVNMREYVVRRNLNSGKFYIEEEDTPACCSPATETYWSM